MNRREFIWSSVAGLSFAAASGCASRILGDAEKPPIGVISYSYREMPMGPFKIVDNALASGVTSLELMGGDLEIDAGAPMKKRLWKLSDQEMRELAAWRNAVDVKKFEDVRKRYEAAGIRVHTVKFYDIDGAMMDHELDYRFAVTRAMGARAITREIPDPLEMLKAEKRLRRLAGFAEKWDVAVAFHNHLQINAKTYEGPLLSWSDKFMVNFDIGHYVASNDDDPLAVVERFHDRISSVHLKDRTTAAHGKKNLQFGQGDTPLMGLFRLMKKNGYSFPCDIELEYAIPTGSDAVREVGISRRYCEALVG